MVLEFIAGAALGGLAFGGGSTHTSHTRTVGVPYVKEVHEHRAPTDESVKILREMEEAARDQIVGAYVCNSNNLTGAVIYKQHALTDLRSEVFVRFQLNGKDYETKHDIMRGQLNKYMDKEKALQMLFEAMSKEISKQLMQQFINSGEFMK